MNEENKAIRKSSFSLDVALGHYNETNQTCAYGIRLSTSAFLANDDGCLLLLKKLKIIFCYEIFNITHVLLNVVFCNE